MTKRDSVRPCNPIRIQHRLTQRPRAVVSGGSDKEAVRTDGDGGGVYSELVAAT